MMCIFLYSHNLQTFSTAAATTQDILYPYSSLPGGEYKPELKANVVAHSFHISHLISSYSTLTPSPPRLDMAIELNQSQNRKTATN